MNRTILIVGVALLMLGLPASAKNNDLEQTKAEIGEEIGVTNASCPLGAGVHTIANGQSISSSLPATTGASCEFQFTPGASADLAQLVLNGLQSDFDLYVKKNAIPTTSSWDCRPYSGGTTAETCQVAVSPGDYVGVMVRRFSGSGTFTVTASSISVPELTNGVPVDASMTGPGQTKLFKLVVPAGSSAVNFAIAPTNDATVAGGVCAVTTGVAPCTPDADLYVRFGAIPTLSSFGCRPWTFGSSESCTFSNEAYAAGANPTTLGMNQVRPFAGPGKYFVMVYAYSGAPSVVLQGATA